MTPIAVAVWLLIGTGTGWLANRWIPDSIFGYAGHMTFGVSSAVIGGWFASALSSTTSGASSILWSIAAALCTAMLLLAILSLAARDNV
ncbi:MAG: GlsB/YeaQ/YmgE family stress response membrane protein [Chloroflexota bacterium]|nr:GlsB/YeaQ/YmgE family stress response membrane protein [Chloroflexota bacterium]